MGFCCESVPAQCYRPAPPWSRFPRSESAASTAPCYFSACCSDLKVWTSQKNILITAWPGRQDKSTAQSIAASITYVRQDAEVQPNPHHLHSIKKSSLSSHTSQQGVMQTLCTNIRVQCFPKPSISLEKGRQTASTFSQRHGVHA